MAQLAALAAQERQLDWEVILVDNGSSDGSRRLADEMVAADKRFKVISRGDREGAAHARNSGVEAARNDKILFCDADDVVADGWLDAMAEALDDAAIVAGSLDLDELNPPWARTMRPNQRTDRLSASRYLPHAGTNNLGVLREVHDAVGGFDESMPNLSDIDFVWRAQLAGYRLGMAAGSLVHYRYRQTIPGILRQAFSYGVARARLHEKHEPHGLRRRSFLLRVTAWASLIKGVPRWGTRSHLARGVFRFGLEAGWLVGRLKRSLAKLVHVPRSEAPLSGLPPGSTS